MGKNKPEYSWNITKLNKISIKSTENTEDNITHTQTNKKFKPLQHAQIQTHML